MKTTLKILVAVLLSVGCMACGDAMDEPISHEARTAQQLDLKNAELQRVRPTLRQCEECYDVVILRQTKKEDGDDTDLRMQKKQIDRRSNAFDGDPVPWPLDEKRED